MKGYRRLISHLAALPPPTERFLSSFPASTDTHTGARPRRRAFVRRDGNRRDERGRGYVVRFLRLERRGYKGWVRSESWGRPWERVKIDGRENRACHGSRARDPGVQGFFFLFFFFFFFQKMKLFLFVRTERHVLLRRIKSNVPLFLQSSQITNRLVFSKIAITTVSLKARKLFFTVSHSFSPKPRSTTDRSQPVRN